MNTSTKSPRRSAMLIILGALLAMTVERAAFTPAGAAGPPPAKPLDGFTLSQVRFDERDLILKPTPKFPKSWRFVGASNGPKENSSTLWFQDADGTIYMAEGFSAGRFMLQPRLHKFEAAR